jgi:hypothetical protein
MNIRFFSLVALLLPVCLFSQVDVFEQQNKETVKKYGIIGRTSWNHAYVGSSPKTEGYKNEYVKYNSNGEQTEKISYKSDGAMFAMESFKYDEYGNNSGYVRYDAKRDKITYKKLMKYNAKGDKTWESGFDGMSNYKNEYTYDMSGKLTQIDYYMGDVLYQKRTFSYTDKFNRMVHVTDAEGNFLFKMKQKTDSRNNILLNIEYAENGSEANKQLFKYNSDNDLLEEVKYENGTLSYKLTYIYNSAGKLVKITQNKQGGVVYDICKYEYDGAGRLIKEYTRKRQSQEFSTKKYTYDNRGICNEYDCYYASYKYRVLFKFTYDYK